MKKLSLFFLLFLLGTMVNGQFVQIAEGPVFAEPGPGYAKILQMKNNNTIFFYFNLSGGLNVQVYDAEYKARTEAMIEPSYGIIHGFNIEGIFEINGDAVVLISNASETSNILYRLILNGKTGELKEEKQIASLKKPAAKKEAITGLRPVFHVSKYSEGEMYAVSTINDYISDTSRRVELVLYGNDNKEIKRAHYSGPQKYKYLQYVDMTVINPDRVVAFIYGYNIEDNEKEGELILAAIDKGPVALGFTELPSFSNDLVIDKGITRYDPFSQRIIMLITANVKSDSGMINSFLVTIDPVTKNLVESNPIDAGDRINKKFGEMYKRIYKGIPQNLFIKDNGGYTIIYEEIEAGKQKDTISHVSVRNIAVVDYDIERQVTSGFLIPIDQDITSATETAFDHSRRQFAGQRFDGQHFLQGNQYKSSLYISDGHTTFVLFNDTQANVTAQSDGKGSQLKDVYNADAFCYKLSGKDIVPKAGYVFGKPVNKEEHTPGLFSVYDYDRSNNLLITCRVEKLGSYPGIKLVWLQPN
ncbi:MAG: hypothetical protein ABIO04_03920 [Ferruginibacter sp.]